jgi:hypothetical protein
MKLHLIKLCVGVDSVADLADWQKQRLRERKAKGQPRELVHITRHMPKRAEELLDGGSLYWVIKGHIAVRQKLLDLRTMKYQGTTHCALVYHPDLILVRPRAYRPFQGWRYFPGSDAPPDLAKVKGASKLPEKLQNELAELGLL